MAGTGRGETAWGRLKPLKNNLYVKQNKEEWKKRTSLTFAVKRALTYQSLCSIRILESMLNTKGIHFNHEIPGRVKALTNLTHTEGL